MVHCQLISDDDHSKHTEISLQPHSSSAIMSNVIVLQTTTVPPTTPTTKTKKKKHHHHHHKHKHHHKKHRHDKSESLVTEQATTSYTSTIIAATTWPEVSQITVSTSQTTALISAKTSFVTTQDSTSAFSTQSSNYETSAIESRQISGTTDSDNYFIKETPTIPAPSMITMKSSKAIVSSFSRPTSRLLAPPRDHPMRYTRPLAISASVSLSPSIIQPIPAKAITSSSRSTRAPAPTMTHSNGKNNNNNNDNDNDNTAYHHKAQIHSSNRDLGLGLGLGFGGLSILALTALLIQNYQKRQRNQNALRTSNHIDNNGVFFTEKPSMFKRKSTIRHSKQNPFISTKWRPQSFLGVVANVITAKFSKRGSSSNTSSFAQFGESGTVDYDPLTYPQPLYSPVKATYQDM